MRCPEDDIDRAMSIVQKIEKEVYGHVFIGEGDVTFQVSLSAGLALWNSDMNKEMLVGQANKVLCFTKNAGKNNLSIYDAQCSKAVYALLNKSITAFIVSWVINILD